MNQSGKEFLVTFIQSSNMLAAWKRVAEKLMRNQAAKTNLVF